MFLVKILALVSVIGITMIQSAPMSGYYKIKDYQLSEGPGMMLFNEIHGLLDEEDSLDSDQIDDKFMKLSREKRLGSLSIVNPLDVLRERVLLELARRKMRQNQIQVDANRRLLQTIGKREINNEKRLSKLSKVDEQFIDSSINELNDDRTKDLSSSSSSSSSSLSPTEKIYSYLLPYNKINDDKNINKHYYNRNNNKQKHIIQLIAKDFHHYNDNIHSTINTNDRQKIFLNNDNDNKNNKNNDDDDDDDDDYNYKTQRMANELKLL